MQTNMHTMIKPNVFLGILMTLATTCSLLLTGCGSKDNLSNTDNIDPSRDDVITILAGSELKDIEPFLSDIRSETGITLKLDYTGTLDGVDAINQGEQVDAAWFSHGKYLSLVNQNKIKAQTPIMLSPVVMGVKQSKAQALGWLTADGSMKPEITWETIADASKSGQLKYAMTNPAASNSGFTALMGVTSAFAGSSDAPTAEDVAKAKPKLKDFFRGQALTSGSSGWLADAYVKQQNELDALVNYESVLMQLNDSGKLNDKLTLIYPKEGIVTADYPFMLLNNAKKESYEKVVAFLKSADMQQKIMSSTNRRPVNTKVALDSKFYQGLLVELPFPNSQNIVDGILMDFANELRNPAFALFLLDVSGSMNGQGIAQLKSAMLGLTGQGDANSSSARFAKFADNEVVVLKPFSNVGFEAHEFTISDSSLPKLQQDINSLTPKGGTAIYSALSDGYQWLDTARTQHENSQSKNPEQKPYYYTIVLMTDGKNKDGIDFNTFRQQYQDLPADIQNIKTFTILFGKADEAEMQRIADATGGRVFDGRNGNLTKVFRKIRGYQ